MEPKNKDVFAFLNISLNKGLGCSMGKEEEKLK